MEKLTQVERDATALDANTRPARPASSRASSPGGPREEQAGGEGKTGRGLPWVMASNRPEMSWKGQRAAFHPDGRRVAILARRLVAKTIDLGNFDRPPRRTEFAMPPSLFVDDLRPQLLPIGDGHAVIVVAAHGGASVLELETGASWRVTDSNLATPITDVVYAVEVGGEQRGAGLITRSKGALLLRADGRAASVARPLDSEWKRTDHLRRFAAAWHATSGSLVVGTEDGSVVCFREGGPHILVRHADIILSVRFASSEVVRTTGGDGTVTEWRLTGGPALSSYQGAARPLVAATRDPSGAMVACTDDGSFVRWSDAASTPTTYASRQSCAATVTASGLRGITLHEEHTVELWDAVANKRLATLDGDAVDLNDLAFTGSGRRVAVRGEGLQREWTIGSVLPL